jgi:hypothetical protein
VRIFFTPYTFLYSPVITALSVINENIDKGDAEDTTRSLEVDAAKLSGVDAANAQLYQDILFASKRSKAQVGEYHVLFLEKKKL